MGGVVVILGIWCTGGYLIVNSSLSVPHSIALMTFQTILSIPFVATTIEIKE